MWKWSLQVLDAPEEKEPKSCQVLPGGFAGTGPNGSFFEAPAWVDKSKAPGTTSQVQYKVFLDWSKFLWALRVCCNFFDLLGSCGGTSRMVDSPCHWEVPLLQPQPGPPTHYLKISIKQSMIIDLKVWLLIALVDYFVFPYDFQAAKTFDSLDWVYYRWDCVACK